MAALFHDWQCIHSLGCIALRHVPICYCFHWTLIDPLGLCGSKLHHFSIELKVLLYVGGPMFYPGEEMHFQVTKLRGIGGCLKKIILGGPKMWCNVAQGMKQASYIQLKDLRDNCKMDLERITGMPLER
ncbi:hypothetical protein Goarm_015900 [Gossypium armourianum]|uniref:Uncharacterized protein n=1 Tax=Gossypium armourianum TaxID=34283 RepID=A0A7J9JAK2_9ROSI|nr:hypothetical protein [Gossypium armourianum]